MRTVVAWGLAIFATLAVWLLERDDGEDDELEDEEP